MGSPLHPTYEEAKRYQSNSRVYSLLENWCVPLFWDWQWLFEKNTCPMNGSRETPSLEIGTLTPWHNCLKRSRGRDWGCCPRVLFFCTTPRSHIWPHLLSVLLKEYGWYVFEHPPYSSDLAPSDFHHFLELKKKLGRTWFQLNDKVEPQCNGFFLKLYPVFYRDGKNR